MPQSISNSVFYATVVALGGFIFGFDASVISGAVGFVTTEFKLNELQQGFVVSAPTLGAVVGSFLAGPMADRFGRKKILITIAALYVISAILSAFANSYTMLVMARMVGGLAFASLVLAPMYIAEISPSKYRGKMISINQLNIVVGFSAAYFANYYILQMSGIGNELAISLGIAENVWRWMLGLEILPAIVFLFLLFIIPESPRWLVCIGQKEKAVPILKKLYPKQNSEQLIQEMVEQVGEVHPSLFAKLKLLFSKHMRLILAIGLIVSISQQITGVNAVYFYAPSIFEQSGIGQDAAFSQAIWVGIINVIFTIFAMLLIDKLGRKPLMLIGLAGVVISMSVAAYGFHQATYKLTETSVAELTSEQVKANVMPMIDRSFSSDLEFKESLITHLGEEVVRQYQAELIQAAANMNSLLIMCGILGFVASFAFSLGPVMWVLLAEIFPNHLRGVGIAFTGLVNSAVSFSIQLLFPWEVATLGTALTFIIYGVFALVGFILVFKLLPETKGRSLEELEHVFHKQDMATYAQVPR